MPPPAPMKTADKSDDHAADNRLDGTFFLRRPAPWILCRRDRFTMNLMPRRNVMKTEKFPMVVDGTRLEMCFR